MNGIIDLLQNFLSPFVVAYILAIMLIPLIAPVFTRIWERRRKSRRMEAGLDDHVVRNAGDGLQRLKKQTLTETALSFGVVLLVPCLLMGVILLMPVSWFDRIGLDKNFEFKKLNIAFVTLVLWTLVSGTEIVKNFLGGLAFRTLVAFANPFQVGDRVTLCGYHGVVRKIGIFFTQLETFDEDLISIPSSSLVSEVLSSANGGQRSSLCSLPFYICPHNSRENVEAAEDAIWNPIQGSLYYDFGKPLVILISQERHALVLTAKCHVTSTYEEPEFASRVTKMVIKSFKEQGISLPRFDPTISL